MKSNFDSYDPDLDDASFDEPLLTEGDEHIIRRSARLAFVAQGTALSVAVMTAAGGAWSVWTNAPAVGGAWSPYIRSVAAIVTGLLGLKVGALLGVIVVAMCLAAVEVIGR